MLVGGVVVVRWERATTEGAQWMITINSIIIKAVAGMQYYTKYGLEM